MIDIPLQEIRPLIKTRNVDGQVQVYDHVRKKYIVLLPEEMVRQMLVAYLIKYHNYPLSRIQLEKGVTQNDKKGRYDIIIYDKAVQPWMLIECKSHKVPLNQKVIDQLSAYNQKVKAPYFMVSNGINTLCFTADHEQKRYDVLEVLPVYMK